MQRLLLLQKLVGWDAVLTLPGLPQPQALPDETFQAHGFKCE